MGNKVFAGANASGVSDPFYMFETRCMSVATWALLKYVCTGFLTRISQSMAPHLSPAELDFIHAQEVLGKSLAQQHRARAGSGRWREGELRGFCRNRRNRVGTV